MHMYLDMKRSMFEMFFNIPHSKTNKFSVMCSHERICFENLMEEKAILSTIQAKQSIWILIVK
ncbi:hypothetical protein BpHYR1_045175 [Brachionus plicatilis]|uniref:Uncharacterized protein n=1 Tax=Brachionus plicatilis TaxID=10195 RepID=A0A3M7QKB5_BRAPC|nr:hypothetical protein BpHYR1_045175 [Brachionus plicatilis]